jgi:hypothetical protein
MTLQKINQVIFSPDLEWEDNFNSMFAVKEKKEPKYVEFAVDPLALVLKWLDEGKHLSEIYSFLENVEYTPIDKELLSKLLIRAGEVRNFFKNSIVFRRLKGEHISSFMEAVEELNENIFKVNVDHIKILVKLPDFYRESMETRELFSKYKSLKSLGISGEIEEPWTFVKKIKRSSKNENLWRYYFSNSKNELMNINVSTSSDARIFLDYICELKTVGFKGTAFSTRQPGHDFYYYKLSNYELYSVTETAS